MRKLYLVILSIVLIIGIITLENVKEKSNSAELKEEPIKPINTVSDNNLHTTNQIDESSEINEYHPIVFAFKDEEGIFSKAEVLGGSKDGEWFSITDFNIEGKYVSDEDFYGEPIDANYVDIDLVKGGEIYKFYSQNKCIAKRKGMKPTLTIPPINGEKILTIENEPFEANEDFAIGINGQWNPLPRVAKALFGENIYSVDIDNDGKDETLRIEEWKTEDKNIIEDTSIDEIEVDIIIQKNGTNIMVRKILVDGIYIESYDVLLLDINGDNKLEILTVERGHNTCVYAYELDGDKVNKVLRYYNGD